MNNRTIAIIFMVISWMMLILSAYGGFPLLMLYSLGCIYLSGYIYHKQDKGNGPGPNIRL